MRRPVQRGDRNATTSACVGWDFNNIENRSAFCKETWQAAHGRRCLLKRLNHDQDHSPDHEDRRYFIDNTIEFLATQVAVGGEILDAAGKKPWTPDSNTTSRSLPCSQLDENQWPAQAR